MSARVAAAELAPLLETYLHEAQHGPDGSGMVTTVVVGGVALEVAASHGWGVRLSRRLPDGSVEQRHLAGDDLTIENARAAAAELTGAR